MNAQAQQQKNQDNPVFHGNVVAGFIVANEDYKSRLAEQNKYIEEKVQAVIDGKLSKQEKINAAKGVATANENITKLKTLIVDVSSDTKQWTKADLTKLATHEQSVVVFESLLKLRDMALQRDTDKKFTPQAKQSQAILNSMVATPQALQQFIRDIRAVAEEQLDVRTKLLTPAKQTVPQKAGLGAVTLPKGVTLEQEERLGAIDQQKALEVLEANKVGVDAKQTMEVPSVIRDAVQALKARAA